MMHTLYTRYPSYFYLSEALSCQMMKKKFKCIYECSNILLLDKDFSLFLLLLQHCNNYNFFL